MHSLFTCSEQENPIVSLKTVIKKFHVKMIAQISDEAMSRCSTSYTKQVGAN